MPLSNTGIVEDQAERLLTVEGRVLAGRYRLLSLLGQGGMGSVWRAEHIELGTPAAVKLIDPAFARNAEAVARFKREAKAVASLRGTHVVQLLDYGVDRGTPFIVMELLVGETLAQRIAQVAQLDPQRTATLLSQVGKAVTRAHESSIIHRDLKPENIFLVREGDEEVAKVLDFGIAKDLGEQDAAAALRTRSGATLGTPCYMSPEQAAGKKNIDYRTDIWSLAVIAFECLVGLRPFEAETLGGLVLAICSEPIPVPSNMATVPAGFDEWFARGTMRDPEQRFQSVKDAMVELRIVCGLEERRNQAVSVPGAPRDLVHARVETRSPLGSPGITLPPSSVTLPKLGFIHRSNRLPWAIAVGLLVLVGATGGGLVLRSRAPTALSGVPIMSASGATQAPIPEESGAHPAGDELPVSLDSLPRERAPGATKGGNERSQPGMVAAVPSTPRTAGSVTPQPKAAGASSGSRTPKRTDYEKRVGF